MPYQSTSLQRRPHSARRESRPVTNVYGSDFYINQSNPNLLSPFSVPNFHPQSRWNPDHCQQGPSTLIQPEYQSNPDPSWYSNVGHYATIESSAPVDHHKSMGARMNSVSNFNPILGTTTPQLRRKLSAISQHIPGSMSVTYACKRFLFIPFLSSWITKRNWTEFSKSDPFFVVSSFLPSFKKHADTILLHFPATLYVLAAILDLLLFWFQSTTSTLRLLLPPPSSTIINKRMSYQALLLLR